MFGKKQEPDPKLEEVSNNLLVELKEYSADSDEYAKILSHYVKVEEIRNPKRDRQFSWDTVIISAANILGIVVIVAYEQKHVFTSKGL